MNRDRLEELWSRFLANDPLSQAEERDLLEALEADPSLRRTLLGEAQIDGWLGVRESNLQDPEAPIRRFLKQVGAEKDGSGFIRKMESRLGSVTRRKTSRPTPSAPSGWNLLLAAAGLLVGIAAFVVLLSEPSRPFDPKVVRPTRAAVEGKLQQIDREQERLSRPPAPQDNIDPADRKKALAELGELRKRTEEELNEAIERGKKSDVARSEEPRRTPEPPLKERSTIPATEPSVATLERLAGDVQILGKEGKVPARADQGLQAGQGVETGAKSLAVVRYRDGSRLELGEASVLAELRDGAKHSRLDLGTLRAQVAKQPKDQPLVFSTPHGEAKVVGTTLRLAVDAKGTRLDVEEGKVELKNLAGKSVLVESGHYAVAAAGTELVAKPFPIDEIVLLAASGKASGSEWRPVKDEKAIRGQAWETTTATPSAPEATQWKDFYSAVGRVNSRLASFVEFRFTADADRDYVVWVRSACLATGPSAGFCDQMAIEAASARSSRPWPAFKDNPGIVEINGHVIKPGYWWVSGDADSTGRAAQEGATDTIPVTIRFARQGPQVLRLYALSTLAHVDAILLTTIRKTRPEDTFVPPGAESK